MPRRSGFVGGLGGRPPRPTRRHQTWRIQEKEKETATSNRGQPGNTQGQSSQLLAIMQALLKPPALSASGHERMVNGRAAVSGEKRLIVRTNCLVR